MTLAPLFFDLDHTLWDFETNSRLALGQGFSDLELTSLGVEDLSTWIRHYEAANDHCWAEFRAGRMDKLTLRGKRFELALEACLARCPEGLPARLGEHYLAHSPCQKALIPGTMEVLQALQDRGHRMWVLTNGFDEVQHLKMDNCNLTPFFQEVYTSDALEVKKPNPQAYRFAAERAGLSAEEFESVVMIGDSLESDVLGAQEVGWRGVHFASSGERHPEAWRTIQSLPQLLELELKG
jgi:putative hydrolase of the HAD superfamily